MGDEEKCLDCGERIPEFGCYCNECRKFHKELEESMYNNRFEEIYNS